MPDKAKKPRGRPPKYDEVNDPEFRIPDTPENIAKAIMKEPPNKEWDYLKPRVRETS